MIGFFSFSFNAHPNVVTPENEIQVWYWKIAMIEAFQILSIVAWVRIRHCAYQGAGQDKVWAAVNIRACPTTHLKSQKALYLIWLR
jgi:hypothetical protein